jgi:phosphoribosylformylglycinamidine (FGAM) synthase-like enzyme
VLALHHAPGGGDEPVPALAVSIDGNGRRVAADPYRGTLEAVLECASNLACVGAEPLGTTNNLNFGNPEKEHIAWQLTESVRALGDACRALDAPIVGGNVSLYNEGATGPIYPTPVIGMVGRLPDARRAGRLGFAGTGDEIALVGALSPSLGASELAKLCGQPLPDGLQELDIDAVRTAQSAVREAVRSGALASTHDIAEGGLAVALAECCLAGGLGASVRLGGDLEAIGLTATLFGEGPGGFLVSGSRDALGVLAEGVPVRAIGTVGGEALRIEIAGANVAISVDLAELGGAHAGLGELFA